MKHKSSPFLGFAAMLALGAMSGAGRADVTVFQGQTPEASGLRLLPWGSGDATPTEEYVYTGIKAIKVKTHGRYQGARLVLEKPIPLKPEVTKPGTYLEMAVLVPERQATSRSGYGPGGMVGPGGMIGPGGMRGPGGTMGPGGAMGSGGMMNPGGRTGRGGGVTGPGGMGGMGSAGGSSMPPGPGGRTGQSGRRGSGGMMGPGGPGGDTGSGIGGPGGSGSDYRASLLTEPKPIRNIRLVVVLTNGKQVDVTMPLEYSRATRDGWRTLSVPFSSLPGLKDAEADIAEVRVFGDSVGSFYLGQIRTVTDETPIRVADIPERTVAVNDEVTFTGSADGGVSQLKYEWTVLKAGEKLDPLPVDAEGRTFKHKFRKGGDYEVHLTVRDVYGLKKPAHTVTKVHVTL